MFRAVCRIFSHFLEQFGKSNSFGYVPLGHSSKQTIFPVVSFVNLYFFRYYMKIKNIIDSMKVRKGIGMIMSFMILGSSCFVCSSCEDMFTAENQLVTTNLAPQDTVYQMMGIVKRMQKLADRTILLGEVRADLVPVNPLVASSDASKSKIKSFSLRKYDNDPLHS